MSLVYYDFGEQWQSRDVESRYLVLFDQRIRFISGHSTPTRHMYMADTVIARIDSEYRWLKNRNFATFHSNLLSIDDIKDHYQLLTTKPSNNMSTT
jgi:hypothetical protein